MKRKLAICFLHTIVLIIIHIVYFNSSINLPLENEVMAAISKAEKYISGPAGFKDSGYLFINTCYDNTTIPVYSEDGFPRNQVVADRKLLSRFFEIMVAKGNHHKFILCDINFDTPSEDDSLLKRAISGVDRVIFPYHYSDEYDSVLQPLFNEKAALADYITYEGLMTKINLYDRHTSRKTLPLLMYEQCSSQQYRVNKLGMWKGFDYVPYSIYPRFFFDTVSIKDYELSLGQVVAMLNGNPLFYEKIIKGKIVVIGNFKTDSHTTLVGFMPGSLILFNAFLTLESGYHLHSPFWFLFLLLTFPLLAYHELYFMREDYQESVIAISILRFLGLTGFCILLSMLSFRIFRIHTTIIPVVAYFELIVILRRLIKENLPLMKKLLVPALLLLCLSAPSQVCFVTSIKGKVDYMGKELRVYDTISYQNVRRLKFAAPGFVTFYSEKGSFKAFYKVDTIAQQHEPVIVFLKDVLRIHGKSVALSSRGGCDCLIPYECVYADPEINDMLLVPDTLFFPARFDHEAYDSGFYFLQWQYNGRVINRRLRTLGNEVIITKEDLYFNDNYYNDPGPEDLVLGLCNYSSGKKMPGIVSKIKPNLISSSSLVDHYKILEKSMTGETPEQIFAAFCTEVYVYYGKPDLCQLKKIIHYKQN